MKKEDIKKLAKNKNFIRPGFDENPPGKRVTAETKSGCLAVE